MQEDDEFDDESSEEEVSDEEITGRRMKQQRCGSGASKGGGGGGSRSGYAAVLLLLLPHRREPLQLRKVRTLVRDTGVGCVSQDDLQRRDPHGDAALRTRWRWRGTRTGQKYKRREINLLSEAT